MSVDPVSAIAGAVSVVAGLVPPPLSERARLLRAAGRALRSVEWYHARWRYEAKPRRRMRWEPRLRARVWVAFSALDAVESSPKSRERQRLQVILLDLGDAVEGLGPAGEHQTLAGDDFHAVDRHGLFTHQPYVEPEIVQEEPPHLAIVEVFQVEPAALDILVGEFEAKRERHTA